MLEKIKHLWFDGKRKTATGILSSLYDMEFKDNEYLDETREYLTRNPNDNLIVYFNHLAYDDPAFVFTYHEKMLDPEGARRRLVVATHWHTKLFNNPIFALSATASSFFYETMFLRIVQKYQVGVDKYGYTEKEALGTYRRLMKKLQSVRREKQPITFFIAPEGHRSEIGRLDLRFFGNGILHIGKNLAPVVYLPLGISYPDGFSRDQLNFRKSTIEKRVVVEPGKPFYQPDSKHAPDLPCLINNLNNALPQEFQSRR